ncbi:selenide, water dikinase SelD [bacterium]|nr:selenide, water dikinase SelD [candidate division CSSED10-310 bacterium]
MQPLKNLFPAGRYPDIISGLAESDDAAVWLLNRETALIMTTDFITPVVDNPRDFGAIAASNALSDIYAMGGKVILALNIACFPKDMDESILMDILLGGAEKVLEAGAVIAGGHTVDDDEPKYGLAVLGAGHPEKIINKSGARPGDVVVVTKPLGAGLIATAMKGDAARKEHVSPAVESMKQLNRFAVENLENLSCHAATDITGFGFIGHLNEIADHSSVAIDINCKKIPMLPGAELYADMWLFPAGMNRNQSAYQAHVAFGKGIDDALQALLFTPETSGGLLLFMTPEDSDIYIRRMAQHNRLVWKIGHVAEGSGILIH